MGQVIPTTTATRVFVYELAFFSQAKKHYRPVHFSPAPPSLTPSISPSAEWHRTIKPFFISTFSRALPGESRRPQTRKGTPL